MASLYPFEDPRVVFGATPVKNMAFNVWIPENALGVDFLEDPNEVVEARVQSAQVIRPKRVRFSPVRPAFVACDNALEPLEKLPVRYVEPVRPARTYFYSKSASISMS